MKLIKNANLYAPHKQGITDVLTCHGKVVAVEKNITITGVDVEVIDAQGCTVTPGLIDQHLHAIGAGGKNGFYSITPEVQPSEFIRCGTTSIVTMLGTDGITKDLKTLYAKVKSLEQEGISAWMLTSYFAVPPKTITCSVTEDMLFIDKIVGYKVAISDERSSFPAELELLRLINQVHLGGLTTSKGGVLHVHLGALDTKMDMLLDIARKYKSLIRHISPTHVGRTVALFDQAIEFAKMGGMIDISTGGTKFDEPYKQVLLALERGVAIDQMTFSSDGNAGMSKKCPETGNLIFYKAPLHLNLEQTVKLVKQGGLGIEEAFKLVTTNPAKNMGLKQKGSIVPGKDADFCFFDEDLRLTDVFCKGKPMMRGGVIVKKGNYEQ